MKRLAWLLLLPLASGALFAQAPGNPGSIIGTLLGGTVGVPYSATLTTSPQAFAAWSYTGSLPPGLSMTAGSSYAATISGTPTVAGTYTFTVQANLGTNPNAGPILVTQAYIVVIAAAQVPPPVSISPSSLPNGTLGTAYLQVLTASGGYGAGTYTFSMDPSSPGSLPAGLTITTAGTIAGTPVALGIFIFSVRVTSQTANGGSVSVSQAYSITITGTTLAIVTTSLPSGTVGVLYSQALAASGGTPPYTWRLTGSTLSVGLTLATSGTFSGTPTTAGSFTYQVTVSDSAQGSATGSFTIRIAPAALVIATSSLPAGTVGSAYTASLAATGGIPPYTWSVAPGSTLPSGLSISSAGVISGTPTASGTFSVTLQATDSAQATATKAYSVTVAAAAAPLSITTQGPLAGAVVGVAYSQAFAATGGASPYQWSILAGGGFLPTGLTLSAAGSLTGTPAPFPGTYPFTVQVADSAGRTATKAFTLTVAGVLIIATANPLPGATVGTPYNLALDLVGGITPFAWSIARGALPAGITLNSTTGALSGTPTTPGTFTFTVSVTGGGQTATQSLTITVAPIITTATLPNATVGTPYSQTLTAGGSGTFTWSVSTGALPAGITLNSTTGALSGTPTTPGTFTFTVSVTGGGQTATQSFTITVTAALTITTATTLPNATVGSAYSQTLAAAGGSGTFTWSVSTGALPGGITLNSTTGALSGTPSAPGAFTFTVSVTGGGQSASQSFTITVGVPQGPAATFTGLPATASPATQPALGIGIPSAYPLAITGQVTLTFTPDSPSPDGGEVVFTTGGRTVSFTVAANTTQVVFSGATPGVQTGTVSGTITLTLKLTSAGIDITPSPAPSTKLTVAKSAPVIKSATVTRTSAGFNLVVVGYATSREMVSATVGFTAAAGVTLASSQAPPISLTQVFTTWYTDPTSAAYGSQFSLTMPFTITNGASTAPLTSVSVQLTNAQGNSNSISAAY
jgi:hypothetical protein